jgi:hypothetical protein
MRRSTIEQAAICCTAYVAPWRFADMARCPLNGRIRSDGPDHERIRSQFSEGCKGCIELAVSASVKDVEIEPESVG